MTPAAAALDEDAVRSARAGLPSEGEASHLEFLLDLIADRVRFRILYALATVDELCVGDLALVLDATEDATSYALRMLRSTGMVQNRRQGRTVMYRLAEDFPRPLLNHCLHQLVRLGNEEE